MSSKTKSSSWGNPCKEFGTIYPHIQEFGIILTLHYVALLFRVFSKLTKNLLGFMRTTRIKNQHVYSINIFIKWIHVLIEKMTPFRKLKGAEGRGDFKPVIRELFRKWKKFPSFEVKKQTYQSFSPPLLPPAVRGRPKGICWTMPTHFWCRPIWLHLLSPVSLHRKAVTATQIKEIIREWQCRCPGNDNKNTRAFPIRQNFDCKTALCCEISNSPQLLVIRKEK